MARLHPLAALLTVALLAGCALPRSGPDRAEVTATAGAELPFEVVEVTLAVASLTRIDERMGFPDALRSAATEATDRLAPGDVLAITVWENIDQGLLNPQGIGASQLPQTMVDARGNVHVPYVGALRAEGRTVAQLRAAIAAALSQKTLNPQVDVFPVRAGNRLVSVQGRVAKPGLYAIETATRRLLPMLAQAGGVGEDPQVIRLRLRRGPETGVIWLEDLYDDPRNDVALRTGDAVIAERDRRIFTALGAVGGPASVPFPTRELSVVRALGTVGGLVDQSADPTGVFVFREEPAAIAQALFPGHRGPIRVAYVLDLTKPGGMFVARDFLLRDRDTLYVTSAPFTRWLKIMQAISPLVNFSSSVKTLGGL